MKQFSLSFLFVFFTIFISAQTTLESNEETVDIIIESIFSNMDEITVTGYEFFGSPEAIGMFQSEGPGFQMESGMVLGSGDATEIIGGFGNLSNPYVNDPDLLIYQPDIELNDCVSLEINFTANASQLNLGFIFASTEYPNYTCSQFNDVMGILLKPDTADDYNIYSLVPNTDIHVSVNSLNSGYPSQGDPSACVEANPNWEETYIYYVDNSIEDANGITIPGFTVPLTASMPLIIGDSYTLKIALCDAFDGAFNSFVFINSQTVDLAFDCPLISANIGDECGSNGGVSLVTADCNCTFVTAIPDIVLDATLDNNLYTVGDNLQLTVYTNNFSTSEYPEHDINIYISQSEDFDPVSSTLIQTYSGAEMSGLDSMEIDFSISNYSLPVSSQPYYLFVDIPPAAGEEEIENNRTSLSFSFEDNNFVTVSLTSEYQIVDLEIGQTSFDFSFNMYNPGPNYLTEAPVNIYWSTDSIHDEADILLLEYQGSDMNINENTQVNLTLDVPQPVVQNPYYVLVIPQPIVRSNVLFDFAISKIQFNPVSVTSIEKTDWNAFFDEAKNLIIKPGNNQNGVYQFALFDQLGRNVIRAEFSLNSGSTQSIETNGLTSGVYMLRIETETEIISGKLVLVK